MVRVVIFILIAILNCAKPEAANPNDQGTDEFWQKQAFLCLVGQINLCTSTPPSPAAPTVTAGNTENIVTWSSVSGATSYNLVYGTSAGVTRASGTVISSVVSPYTHSGLTNNTTYYYTVVAKVGTTESNLSQEASATPFCSPCRIFGTSSTFNV
jgi:Tfp pilus assembly protein PilX